MALDISGGLFKQTDVRETPVSVSDADKFPPIGAVIAWLKTLSGTPALPGGWVECNGQTISDGDSAYNGVTLPNLNSTNRFLRGSTTSGGTGGTDNQTASGTTGSHTLTINEMPSHNHDTLLYKAGTPGSTQYNLNAQATSNNADSYTSDNTGGGAGHTHSFSDSFDNKPLYINVVWIIRIK